MLISSGFVVVDGDVGLISLSKARPWCLPLADLESALILPCLPPKCWITGMGHHAVSLVLSS